MAQTDTHTHTDGHGDSMTNSAQWGRVGEKNAECDNKDNLQQNTVCLEQDIYTSLENVTQALLVMLETLEGLVPTFLIQPCLKRGTFLGQGRI